SCVCQQAHRGRQQFPGLISKRFVNIRTEPDYAAYTQPKHGGNPYKAPKGVVKPKPPQYFVIGHIARWLIETQQITDKDERNEVLAKLTIRNREGNRGSRVGQRAGHVGTGDESNKAKTAEVEWRTKDSEHRRYQLSRALPFTRQCPVNACSERLLNRCMKWLEGHHRKQRRQSAGEKSRQCEI
ncbi:hypothetical protein F442_01723, partial [Phytophthora nicotianae P10297]